MKTIKSLFMTVVITIAFFSMNNAQDNNFSKESLAKRAFDVCLTSLDSKIPGIVESTIYNVILVKKYYPSGNFSSIIERLNEISEDSNDPAIRFKAHLASIYLSFSNVIDVQPLSQTFEREYIFRQITDQLESNLLVSN